MLEPGNYTFTLNFTNLVVGETYSVDYRLKHDRAGFGSELSNTPLSDFNATTEYVHLDLETVEVDEYTCHVGFDLNAMQDDRRISHEEFHFNGMCEESPSPFELYYDNGSGPVLWEMTSEVLYFEDWACNEYDDGHYECWNDWHGHWEHFEHCEYDNTTMLWACEGWGEPPMLEAGDYTFTLNVTDLEVGTNYSLVYDAFTHSTMGHEDLQSEFYDFTATAEYVEWIVNGTVTETTCEVGVDVYLTNQSSDTETMDNFHFNGMCEEPPSMFELYYDNGSGPVLWEITPEMRYFEYCSDHDGHYECWNENGHWEHFEDCEYDNTTMEWACGYYGGSP